MAATQFFALPSEVLDFVRRAAQTIDLQLMAGIPTAMHRIDRGRLDGEAASDLLLGTEVPVGPITSGDIGRYGLVRLTLPQLSAERLTMTELIASANWRDPQSGENRRNPAGLRLKARLRRELAAILSFPVEAMNPMTGGLWQRYPQIGYSRAVAALGQNGPRLCQRGVANVVYRPGRPDPN